MFAPVAPTASGWSLGVFAPTPGTPRDPPGPPRDPPRTPPGDSGWTFAVVCDPTRGFGWVWEDLADFDRL